MEQVAKKFEQVDSDALPAETILVVDDSRAQRQLVSSFLRRWDYQVLHASSGAEALELCRKHPVDIVVSDWMMPGMTGLELCKAFRHSRGDRYGYFILLTTKSEKDEIAQGLDVGADDFLSKPFNPVELRARIRAGERILKMERELLEKNRLIGETLDEMKALYLALDRDLIEARKLQQSLVRDRHIQLRGADVSMMLQPAGRVGGDLVGAYPIATREGTREVGFYSMDISGHGLASALLSARMAGHLTGATPTQNLAVTHGDLGPVLRSPEKVVEALNKLILGEIETEHYFTILLGHANLVTGKVKLCQAGHPHPAIQRADGMIEFTGTGGLPVGLITDAEYSCFEIQLKPGDRLFLGSDGITECEDTDGDMLEEEGFADMLRRSQNLHGQAFLEALSWDLNKYNGDKDFADDVSGVLFEYHGLE